MSRRDPGKCVIHMSYDIICVCQDERVFCNDVCLFWGVCVHVMEEALEHHFYGLQKKYIYVGFPVFFVTSSCCGGGILLWVLVDDVVLVCVRSEGQLL